MRILAILSFILLMSKCKRDETAVNTPCTSNCMIFKIYVGTDQKAATPVSNVPLELAWEGNATELGQNKGRLIATGTTKSDGTVTFSFNALPNELKTGYYYLKAQHSTEYYPQYNTSFTIRKADSVVNTIIHLSSRANLKIVYNNFAPKISSDRFNVFGFYKSYINQKEFGRISTMPGTSFRFGDGAFTSREAMESTAGNDWTYLFVNRNINGVETQVKDSIYLAKGEVKTYSVNY